jgi:hypothetical protein
MIDYLRGTRLKLLGTLACSLRVSIPNCSTNSPPCRCAAKWSGSSLSTSFPATGNCPQYITSRFTAAEVEKYAAPLEARIAELEAQLAARDDPELGSIDDK